LAGYHFQRPHNKPGKLLPTVDRRLGHIHVLICASGVPKYTHVLFCNVSHPGKLLANSLMGRPFKRGKPDSSSGRSF
jgi:hypothetical protein